MSMVETTATTSVSTIEALDDRGSAVRFESQCVVIPDLAHRSRLPRVVTKSYTLPLWKKRTSSECPSASVPTEDASVEENQSHLVLRLPLPTFSLKHHSTTRSVDRTPPPPCLVHRTQPSSPPCSSTPLTRHTHTSRKTSPSPSRSDIVTLPLRPCCATCQSATEAALVGGDAWPERFSRAASRRRSMSADGTPRTITVAGSAASASYGTLGVSISVDEIDKRRRSSDTGRSISSQDTLSDDAQAKEECRMPLILRRTAASSSSVASVRTPPSPTRISPATPRIPEEEDEDEDENELFPLPSPKRTPTPSPSPSPAGSLSSLMAIHASQSATASSCSGDSAAPHLNRRRFLAPPPCSSSSSLSLPKLCESMTDLTLTEDLPRPPSPSLLSTLPPLSSRLCSRSPSPRISFVPPTPTDTLSCAADGALLKSPQSAVSALVSAPITLPPSPSSPQLSPSPHPSPMHTRFSWRSKRSVSAGTTSRTPSATPTCSPSVSPTLSFSSNTKRSFSMSNSRHIIADVLRGVGAMGPSGIGPRV